MCFGGEIASVSVLTGSIISVSYFDLRLEKAFFL